MHNLCASILMKTWFWFRPLPLSGQIPNLSIFRHASVSSTNPCLSVRWSVGRSYFQISILSASLVAFPEKLKNADPNYFSILGLDRIP